MRLKAEGWRWMSGKGLFLILVLDQSTPRAITYFADVVVLAILAVNLRQKPLPKAQ